MTRTDSQIQEDILEELKWEPPIDAPSIGVAVTDGVVTLTGIVDSYNKKVLVERAASRILGVKAIAEDIRVQVGKPSTIDDTELARAATEALKYNSAFESGQLMVIAEDGWLVLKGEVETLYQKESAEQAVEELKGLSGVSNLITIMPSTLRENIKDQITEAFKRSATIDSARIQVETEGNVVTLSGTVKSISEKREAERVAWKGKGVKSVMNNLVVTY